MKGRIRIFFTMLIIIEGVSLMMAFQQPSNIATTRYDTKRNTRGNARVLLARKASSELSEVETLSSVNLLQAADCQLRNGRMGGGCEEPSISDEDTSTKRDAAKLTENQSSNTPSSRRLLFASGLIGLGVTLGNIDSVANALTSTTPTSSTFQWQTTPYNKRTGVTVYEAEEAGYNVRFVTYLSRFLLCFDSDCQFWWYNRARDLPLKATAEEVQSQRLAQFGAFSTSVEVGLIGYSGPGGPARLMQSLLRRFCLESSMSSSDAANKKVRNQEQQGLAPPSSAMDAAEEKRRERISKSARRHIALLFGLMEANQPSEEITKVLAAIDNGSVSSVEIVNPGSGYAPGYGPPQVFFPPPDAGTDYEQATGRAVLSPNGKILRIDVVNRGLGYVRAPTVTIAPPAVVRFGDKEEGNNAVTAQAVAFLFRSGPNKGRIERIQLTNPGEGYGVNEIIKIRFTPPETRPSDGGVTASATAVLEYQVSRIDIYSNGTGYAVEKPIEVAVESPPLTARVNMNDPMMARVISGDEPLPFSTIPDKKLRAKMPDPSDPASVTQRAIAAAAKTKGCIGRACYDEAVVAIAYPVAERDSYSAFRTVDEMLQPQRVENAIVTGLVKGEMPPYVSASSSSTSASDSGLPDLPNFGAGTSSSTQLLSLLPAGVGLEYSPSEKRYLISVDPNFFGTNKTSSKSDSRAYDPDFGPRGRSPIEREMELGWDTYLRFVASGAVCCSGVHLALTPIDVIKTKVQTDPKNYPGMVRGFQRTLSEGGATGFFAGWKPTFLGFFVWGGLSYALTEFLRRYFTELLGSGAAGLEVPIILSASAVGSFFGAFILCPFESVRIRSVAQPDFGDGVVSVVKRMVKEEGLDSLFKAVPAFCAKEIPFAMGKFTVFDLSTKWLYDQFPAAREDIQLSLLVSLAGGTLGGLVAAVVSNPGDATVSELKKAKSSKSPLETAQMLVDRGGPAALFTGLPLRLLFYPLVVSLQFLIYDSVRLSLGIGSDDLKLYLDVLGGALKESTSLTT